MKAAPAARFTLRDYRPSDFQRLCDIDRACFAPNIFFPPKQMRHTLSEDGAFAVVAEAGGQALAGFVVARKMKARTGHVITVDVLRKYRRQGLASQLMHAAEERLRQQGIEQVRLETAVDNLAAQKLFHRLGYVQTGTIERYYPNGADAWVMQKSFGKR